MKTERLLGVLAMRVPVLGSRSMRLLAGSCVVASALVPGRAADAQWPAASREIHHIHGVALDRRNPEVVYVATHTGLARLRSNAEPEWVGSLFDLMGFTAHPTEASLVYASGHPDLETYRKEKAGNLGLLVSRDGGQTWRSVALKGGADFHALAYSPRNGGTLYGWSVGGQLGLHRISVSNWRAEPVPTRGLANVLSLAASPDPSGPLFAGTKAGLVVSRDGGTTWLPVAALPLDALVSAVGAHQADSHLVYAYTARPDRGLLRSRNGGSTWEPTEFIAPAQALVVALAVGPGDHVVVATSGSDVFRSGDGGRTWQPVVKGGRPVAAPR